VESFLISWMGWKRRERFIDIAAQAAHLPMRVYVMGDRQSAGTCDGGRHAQMRHSPSSVRVGASASPRPARIRTDA